MKANYLALFVVMFCSGILFSQTEKIAFEKYGVAEGLPEEVAYRFVQDKLGFIWICTQNGLVKFDGYEMEVFRANLDDPDGLHLRNLNGGILIASDDKLWIAGVAESGGLASYNPKTEKFTNYEINILDSTKVPYNTNSLLFEDIAQNIWFGSYGNDGEVFLCKINPRTKEVSRYPYRVGRKSNDVILNFEIAESKADSAIWFRSVDFEMFRYDRKKDVFESQFRKGDIIPGTNLTDSIVDINTASKSGLISMANNQRLFLFDPLLRKVVDTYTFTNRDEITWGASFEDKHGDFWVSSHDNLTRINREQGSREDFKFGQDQLDFEILGEVLQMIPMNQNHAFLFFGVTSTDSNNGRFEYTLRYDFEMETFELFDTQFNDKDNQFVDNGVRRNLVIDKSGLLWVGTRPNIYKQSSKTRQIDLFKHDSKDNLSLPSDIVTLLFEDSKQKLWVGTNKGIARMDNNSFQTFGWFTGSEKGDSIGNVISLIEDSNGVLWVGTNKGLFKWSDSKNSFQKLYEEYGEFSIMTLAEDSKERIWVSVLNGGVFVLDITTANIISNFDPENVENHGLTSARIYDIYLDTKDQVWLGDPIENEKGLFRYLESENKFKHYVNAPNDSTSIGSNEIHFMVEDDKERLWIGTDGGINLYNSLEDNFSQNNDGINLPSTNGFVKATDGKIWIVAYSGGGLALVGPEINDVIMYGENTGLLHNDATNIVFDDLGKLWLPTERGLSVFDTISKKYTSYFEKDGFQKYGRFNSVIKTHNGDIWIGGRNGLNHITPEKLSKKDTTVPSVYITSMAVLDSLYSAPDGELFTEAVSYTEEIQLKHWQKDLSFDFVAIHYLRPEDNLYSWKLDNYDNHWSIPSKDRKVSYTNLSPGTYTFLVKGANADGVWNETPTSLKIIIANPWWLTIWAYLVYGLVLITIGYRVHVFQKERTLRLAREKSQLIELEQAKEIKKAYADLKATQNQLIQSEKMASLGELTAGIAHEIQNPLNFVNNFSELNTELIEELEEEIGNKNLDEVKALAKDIKENELKINHHGKRADSIVKGMLQHSRTSSGKKEATDINTLVDEFLRLSYHGLRAKDKSFNATMNTNFDENIEKVHIVAQDIGRVVLNLITNAFHAVQEKKKKTGSEYEPTVSVETNQKDKELVISIIDNGNGIPEKILNKIFHPFFTTKASGQGTGLGLSLSYDIMKAHGGDLKVDTTVGKGTTFLILIPIE